MALRLLRTRKINIISMLGVMLGLSAIIVVMSVMDGFQRELRDMIRGSLSDLIVELDTSQVESYREVKAAVEAVDGVAAVTLQRHTFGLINTQTMTSDGGRDNYLPVRIVAILPGDEARVSRVLESFRRTTSIGAKGKAQTAVPKNPFALPADMWKPEEMPRVVVSDWIARRLGGYGGLPYRVGEQFPLITPTEVIDDKGKKVHFADREVVVSGTYRTGNSEFDKLHVYVDLRQVRDELFSSEEGSLAELRVKLDDYTQVNRVRESVARVMAQFDPSFGKLPPEFKIGTWEERQRTLLLAVNNEKFLLAFVLFFIIVVACFTIFATLTMTVAEKTREIGVLRALGATPGGILTVFMLNGTLVGLLGAGLGYACGLFVAHNVEPIRVFLRDTFGWDIFPPEIYLFDEIPTFVDHAAATWFALGAVAWALVFSIIPAVRAARLRPVVALRYE
ncbi:MAG: ABC transporter permease [Planctomycetota bacterium]|jgi:lipoprotein-releasing system permease protein